MKNSIALAFTLLSVVALAACSSALDDDSAESQNAITGAGEVCDMPAPIVSAAPAPTTPTTAPPPPSSSAPPPPSSSAPPPPAPSGTPDAGAP